MPQKANAARRHHIPRPKCRVTNWAEYDATLRQRGSLTVWVTDEAIASWKAAPRTTRGGQPNCSDLAITTALMLCAVFHLALRQTEGLIGCILQLLGLDLPVPDRSTIARRTRTVALPSKPRSSSGPLHLLVDSTGLKLCGPSEWLIEKHGTKKRRSWRKLHLGVDAENGRIVAATLTDRDGDDAAQVGPLLDQIDEPVAALTGDGAYDRTGVYASVHQRHPEAAVVAPPRADVVLSDTAATAPTQRDRHIQMIAENGRMAWQRDSQYNVRARVEGQIGRWKQVIGPALRFHTDEAQATEVAIAAAVLNRMLDLGRPNSVRVS
ncbi:MULTISPECIES: IS5 family transposase [Azospirillum]|uniref:IS5 family transposase n=1 Tax=Azospirillum baldaniorum TaxID=1064539 RepID=UPI00157A8FB4|nr:IS5 family transposase [Azospirillum baldaniorum]NUB07368.1 IS5 family transposase [Azospirillum baldaniorum]